MENCQVILTLMTEAQRKEQISIEEPYEPVIIDSAVQKPIMLNGGAIRICWNTGEQKNCPGCYLSKGCKAKV
jgi:hypothetical protein